MSKNADLPAAPTIYADMGVNGQREIFCDNQGLTKREHFAAIAIQGMIAAEYGSRVSAQQWAKDAVEVADALLAELDK